MYISDIIDLIDPFVYGTSGSINISSLSIIRAYEIDGGVSATASSEAIREFDKEYDLLFSKCIEAVHDSGFELLISELNSGRIEAKSGMGLRSFGENITIQVNKKSGSVHVFSKSALSTTMFDWGKNRDNVTKFFEHLSSLLNEGET